MISDQDRQIADETFDFIERSNPEIAPMTRAEARRPSQVKLPTPLGYQDMHLEVDSPGTRYLYMGGNYVAFTPDEWAAFVKALSPAEQRCLNCGARDGQPCESWCAYKPEGRPMPDVSMALAEHTQPALDAIEQAGRPAEMAWCENPTHPGHGTTAHPLADDCTWPHLVGPSGPYPVVGHPLTVHD